jgi:hypothetical protein
VFFCGSIFSSFRKQRSVLPFHREQLVLTGSSSPQKIGLDDYYQKEEQQLPANTRVVVLPVMSELREAHVVVVLAKFDCTITTEIGPTKLLLSMLLFLQLCFALVVVVTDFFKTTTSPLNRLSEKTVGGRDFLKREADKILEEFSVFVI